MCINAMNKKIKYSLYGIFTFGVAITTFTIAFYQSILF